MSTLHGIPAENLPEWYDLLEPAFIVMAANSGGRWQVVDIVRLIGEKVQQVWISLNDGAVEAVLLTEIIVYPRKKALRFSSCVGKNWQNWAGFHEQIEEWGRAQGCDLFEVFAPRKWRHCFPEYREYHVMLERKP
jgi:hypothetical protein